MRVLFWGTPEFAVPSLRALQGEGHDVVGVVTQPDRPAGRGRRLRPSPIRIAAEEEGLPVLTPERPRGESFLSALRELTPRISVVVAYGHILRPEVLELPPLGSINVHASLLPELRGAAPIHWAIARGHGETGITIMRMTEGMDEGPILLQRTLPIAPEDTTSSLAPRLAELGAEALVEALALLETGVAEAVEQAHERATYAPKVGREAARIDWSRSARDVANHIRGMDRNPGAWTLLDELPVKVFGARIQEEGEAEARHPGTILRLDPGSGLVVSTGRGAVALAEIQLAGKRRMDAAAWARGSDSPVGIRFG